MNDVPKRHKAIAIISDFVHKHVPDSFGSMHYMLIHWCEEDALLSQHYDAPLSALKITLERILLSPESLHEFVRQVDVRYSQDFQEKPLFQKPGEAAHPDDEYTHESVGAALKEALKQL